MSAAAAHSAFALDGPPDPELIRIRHLIYQVAGIFHPDNKPIFFLDRCVRRMREIKSQSLREYFDCLTVRPNCQAELVALLNEITITFELDSYMDEVHSLVHSIYRHD